MFANMKFRPTAHTGLFCSASIAALIGFGMSGAFAQTAAPKQPGAASDTSTAPVVGGIEEVVVTAEKRSSDILHVPASVQAISGDRLKALNVTSLTDLTGLVPSLTLSSYGAPGMSTLEIRGLGDGATDRAGSLVSTYVDDFAVGSSTAEGGGNLAGLDLMPYDIDHVEVLEGPQGTLYGADAMGGIVKYVLKQPDLNQFSGEIGSNVAHEDNSGSADYQARGYLNIPLIDDELGLRISAFDKNDAGYINNIGISKTDSNSSNEAGGRVALLWKPTDKLTIKAGILLQDIHEADFTYVELKGPSTGQPLYGNYINNSHFAQPFTQQTAYYTGGGSYDFGFATLSSVVGYSKLKTGLDQDFTPYAVYTHVPGALALWQIRYHVEKFSEETRLTSNGDGPFSWIIGQYYTREVGGENANMPTFTSSYVPLPASDNVLIINMAGVYREVSVFGDLTYKLTDNFDLTGGGRWSHYTQDTTQSRFGILGAGVSPDGHIAGDVETWMANARYHIDENQMVYVRVATGFRPGTPNVLLPTVPAISQPDTTTDYEIGYKGSLLQDRLELTATAFHIDWKNLQEPAYCTGAPGNCSPKGFSYIANSGGAVSDGLELSTAYRVTDELTLGLNAAYTDARLTADAVSVGGTKGDQLPISAKLVGSVTADYVHPIDDQLIFIAGASYRHRDGILNQFPGVAGGALPFGPQDSVDAYTGAYVGAYSIRLYATNLFNDRSYTGLQFTGVDGGNPRAVPFQPQTFGLSIDYKFQ